MVNPRLPIKTKRESWPPAPFSTFVGASSFQFEGTSYEYFALSFVVPPSVPYVAGGAAAP